MRNIKEQTKRPSTALLEKKLLHSGYLYSAKDLLVPSGKSSSGFVASSASTMNEQCTALDASRKREIKQVQAVYKRNRQKNL